jgi:hypothetical protein
MRGISLHGKKKIKCSAKQLISRAMAQAVSRRFSGSPANIIPPCISILMYHLESEQNTLVDDRNSETSSHPTEMNKQLIRDTGGDDDDLCFDAVYIRMYMRTFRRNILSPSIFSAEVMVLGSRENIYVYIYIYI